MGVTRFYGFDVLHLGRLRVDRLGRRGQSGVSLVEVLVGVAVMVPLTLASVTGLMVGIKVSAATEEAQRLEAVLATTTEDLKSVPYLPCGTAAEYQDLYEQWAAPLSKELIGDAGAPSPKITAVAYWNRNKATYTASCSGDDGAQRLIVTISGDDRDATGSVVKRDAVARVGSSG